MDETPVNMDMVMRSTVNKKGEKTVLGKTTGHEKTCYTLSKNLRNVAYQMQWMAWKMTFCGTMKSRMQTEMKVMTLWRWKKILKMSKYRFMMFLPCRNYLAVTMIKTKIKKIKPANYVIVLYF